MARLTRAEYERVVDEASYAGLEDVREDYSGRGMYGAGCFGIVAEDVAEVVPILRKALGAEAAMDLLEGTVTDSMGRDIIVYFPSVTVEVPDDIAADVEEKIRQNAIAAEEGWA